VGQFAKYGFVALAAAGAALAAFAPTAAANKNAESGGCHFVGPAASHSVSYHRGVSCAQAKAILRELRGGRDLVPHACGHDRIIDGWRLSNLHRSWTGVGTSYRKGRVEIHYYRHQSYYNTSCPGIGPKDDQQDWIDE
jgi:hypothetical protein